MNQSLEKSVKLVKGVLNRLYLSLEPMIIIMNGFKPKNVRPVANVLQRLDAFYSITESHRSVYQREAIVNNAQSIIDEGIDIFGKVVSMNELSWNVDYLSGYVWPRNVIYSKIKISEDADIKFPWELSRCQWITVFAEAYDITRSEKYRDLVIKYILSWIDGNPYCRGVNWMCSMETAIRAVNFIYSFYIINKHSQVPLSIQEKFISSIYQHGEYIYKHLENGEIYNANHYLADLAGLIFIGTVLPGNKDADCWRSFSTLNFYKEIRDQFLPSGFHFEKSISYHRLTSEIVITTINLLKTTGDIIPRDIEKRVELMRDVAAAYIKPNGRVPNIGDEDDGRFLVTIPFEPHEHRHLCKSGDYKKDVCCVYSDVGFAIYKKSNRYLFFNNSGVSRYTESNIARWTHSHCDLLSFEYSSNQIDWFVDPGTYVYTSDRIKRNEFRSTKKHNTVVIDGIDQYEVKREKPFQLLGDVNILPLSMKILPDSVLFSGGYSKMVGNSQIEHNREIEILKECVIIFDDIIYEGQHEAVLCFHLSSNVKATINGLDVRLECLNDTITLSFESKDIMCIEVKDDEISPSYARLQRAECIMVSVNFNNKLLIKTHINETAN